eukprot:TRINITY_DN344_c0_g1_i4.p3 TRINITY_DN344_c0_g1~~TRINITY_DN344_c0_g1_i4.p3  ORF type:complete len:142 (-),score=71.95 TRINITY_DN344_c0_g1_i4:157-537(-)
MCIRDRFGGGLFGKNMFQGFGGGFPSGGQSSFQSYSSSSGFGGGGGQSSSTSTSTITRNGKTVQVTKTTITNPDGTQQTKVEEKVLDGGRTINSNAYLQQGNQYKQIGNQNQGGFSSQQQNKRKKK